MFLTKTTYESLAAIKEQIATRGGKIALSTISKALKRLESDLIIDRNRAAICLRQPDKLLDKLSASYQEPEITRTLTCSSQQKIEDLLAITSKTNNFVLTGRSSVSAYAVMGRNETPVIYAPNIDRLLDTWGSQVEETSRFVDLEIRQTNESTVYFDSRFTQSLPCASPIQTFLELSSGEKREQEVAAQVREFILRELKK